jgi:hypothetical protein
MKRTLFTLIMIAALPLFASNAAPSGSVAFAGHTVGGNFCTCGCPGCICDPDETTYYCFPDAKEPQGARTQPAGPAHSDPSSGTAAVMLIGAAGFLFKRFRR